MININFGVNFVFGCVISIFGIGIYAIRFINPKLSEEKDVLLSTLFVLYGGIMIIHGWRLDPILFFSQMIVVFLAINFFFESLGLRLILVKQKKKFGMKKRVMAEISRQNVTDKDPIDILEIFK
jgi:hypothetical protein